MQIVLRLKQFVLRLVQIVLFKGVILNVITMKILEGNKTEKKESVIKKFIMGSFLMVFLANAVSALNLSFLWDFLDEINTNKDLIIDTIETWAEIAIIVAIIVAIVSVFDRLKTGKWFFNK